MIRKAENIILKKRLRKRTESLKGKINASDGKGTKTGS